MWLLIESFSLDRAAYFLPSRDSLLLPSLSPFFRWLGSYGCYLWPRGTLSRTPVTVDHCSPLLWSASKFIKSTLLWRKWIGLSTL